MRKHPSCHACEFHVQRNVTKLPTCPWWSQTQWPASMPTRQLPKLPSCPQNSPPKKTPTTIPRLSQLTSAPHIIHKFGQAFDTSKIPGCVMEHHMFLIFLYRFDNAPFSNWPSGLSILILKGLPPVFNSTASTCISFQRRALGQIQLGSNPTSFLPVWWVPAAATHHSLSAFLENHVSINIEKLGSRKGKVLALRRAPATANFILAQKLGEQRLSNELRTKYLVAGALLLETPTSSWRGSTAACKAAVWWKHTDVPCQTECGAIATPAHGATV